MTLIALLLFNFYHTYAMYINNPNPNHNYNPNSIPNTHTNTITNPNSNYPSASKNTYTIKEFIKDENMLDYLNNVFSSVQFPTYNDNKHNNHYHHNCYCNGCYIENECLSFLRQHICEKIKGTYCDN